MSRHYDSAKNEYGSDHRAYSGQNACHVLGDEMLSHYGCNQDNYSNHVATSNYRMGDTQANGRDTRVDNRLMSEIFTGTQHDGLGGYNAHELANNGRNPVNMQQQLDRVHRRFEVAQDAYRATGEHKYLMMQSDLREVAGNHLNADLRQFRMTDRKQR